MSRATQLQEKTMQKGLRAKAEKEVNSVQRMGGYLQEACPTGTCHRGCSPA